MSFFLLKKRKDFAKLYLICLSVRARIEISSVFSHVSQIIEQIHEYLLSFVYFRPLRNASPENYVSACDCYDADADADDADGAPDSASERPFPVDSDDLPEGPGCL